VIPAIPLPRVTRDVTVPLSKQPQRNVLRIVFGLVGF
jgi:hypothetical protein